MCHCACVRSSVREWVFTSNPKCPNSKLPCPVVTPRKVCPGAHSRRPVKVLHGIRTRSAAITRFEDAGFRKSAEWRKLQERREKEKWRGMCLGLASRRRLKKDLLCRSFRSPEMRFMQHFRPREEVSLHFACNYRCCMILVQKENCYHVSLEGKITLLVEIQFSCSASFFYVAVVVVFGSS